jgi:hypothetical protein
LHDLVRDDDDEEELPLVLSVSATERGVVGGESDEAFCCFLRRKENDASFILGEAGSVARRCIVDVVEECRVSLALNTGLLDWAWFFWSTTTAAIAVKLLKREKEQQTALRDDKK